MRIAREESGFSLTELIVVVGLIGFVLAGAYALAYAAVQSGDQSQALGTAARDTGKPLEFAEKYIMQCLEIQQADAYRLQYRLDRDLATSDESERHVLEVDDEGRLTLTSTPLGVALTPVGSARTAVLSTDAGNLSEGEPLFRYYDVDGEEILDTGRIPSDTRAIRVTLVVEQNGLQHSDSRFISLRNRE